MKSTFKRTISLTSILILLFCLSCSSTSQKRSIGEVVDDNVISLKLKSRLSKDKLVPAKKIKAKVWKGVVTLKGTLDNQVQIDRAIQIAEQQKGVQEVKAYLMLSGWGNSSSSATKTAQKPKKKSVWSFLNKKKSKQASSDKKELQEQTIAGEEVIKPNQTKDVNKDDVATQNQKPDYNEFKF
jgi:hypothetical protein